MYRVLRPGGYWLHMGPLLWHWADGSWEELSVELSLADVQQAALLMGFKTLSQEFVDAAYIGETRLACVEFPVDLSATMHSHCCEA
jgi:carnosine N-methyltransferase